MDFWSQCIYVLSLFVVANGIMFNLPPNTQKCLREELQQNVPVKGEYEISEAPGQKVDYIVSRESNSEHIPIYRQIDSRLKTQKVILYRKKKTLAKESFLSTLKVMIPTKSVSSQG